MAVTTINESQDLAGKSATTVDMATTATVAAVDEVTTWRIDSASSSVAFTIGHSLALIPRPAVVGRFKNVSGTVLLEERRPATARIEIIIDSATIDTGEPRRDAHLRSASFFDIARFPTLTFVSRMVEEVDRSGGRYRIMGDLTIHGVSRAVRVDLNLARQNDSGGEATMAATVNTVINRRDYGLDWNSLFMRVSDAVAITLTINSRRDVVVKGAPSAR